MNEKLLELLEPIFDEMAHPSFGVLGYPDGELAYAYVRVSSTGQAEDGRSGLPRQLHHIHERATSKKICIPYDLLFADDHTGFEFRERPELQRLLSEISRPDRAANHVVIEDLDRLSRNAQWHQGYLIDVFKDNRVEMHFWKEFNSDIERAVFGAISEQGMRHEKERMVQGMRMKAKSGRITAKRCAYGYLFADSEGRPSTDPASNYRKDTHYIPNPDTAPILKEIYHRRVAGESLYQICDDLERRQVPTPQNAASWYRGNLYRMIRKPLYKGVYVCNRHYERKEWDEKSQRMKKKLVERPEEEWVTIPVPPIVSTKIWEEAQKALKRNAKNSTRNAKSEFLLQGFIVCGVCGSNFRVNGTTKKPDDSKRRPYYVCGSYMHVPVLRKKLYCKSPWIRQKPLDSHVWEAVCSLITDPDILISYIEEESAKFQRGELNDQLTYIERQLIKCNQEEKKWDEAYTAEIFTLGEYRDKKRVVNDRRDALLDEQETLREEMEIIATYEQKRELIYDHLGALQEAGFALELPFKEKRQILSMLIDQVVINTHAGWYRLEGVIEGTYQYNDQSSGHGGGGGGTPWNGEEHGVRFRFPSAPRALVVQG